MGYYSWFKLELTDRTGKEPLPKETVNLLIACLHAKCRDAEYAFDTDGWPSDPLKWHDFEKDMRAFSEKTPGVLFCLTREGDDKDDFSKDYFLDGKHQGCKGEVVYPPFDPGKLT